MQYTLIWKQNRIYYYVYKHVLLYLYRQFFDIIDHFSKWYCFAQLLHLTMKIPASVLKYFEY
jgi:hypothetical protein